MPKRRKLRSTRGRFISRAKVEAGARAGRRRGRRVKLFWILALPTAAFFILRRLPATAPLISRLRSEAAVPEGVKAFFLSKAQPTVAEAALSQPVLHIQLGPGSIGGSKRWLPPGSTIDVMPCPAGYARAKMSDDGAPWPTSPGPGWIQDSTVGLGNCRKA